MQALAEVAPAFVEMAHRIVWSTVATVDSQGRPRSRILHPLWQWDGTQLVGWVGTGPTPTKQAHLRQSPFVSVTYWAPDHDTCTAECRASWGDATTRRQVWELFSTTPEPVGYNPTMIPGWDSPEAETFAVLRLEPWRLRVFPGTLILGQGGTVLTWQE